MQIARRLVWHLEVAIGYNWTATAEIQDEPSTARDGIPAIPDCRRLVGGIAGQRPRGPIADLAPDLAVEVLSQSNTRKEMNIKLGEYFAAGTRLVWYVDPKSRSVEVFTSPESITRLCGQDRLTGGDVLPGFEVAVADLFPSP